MRCDELFLVKACSSAFDAIEFVIDFIRAVKGYVDQGAAREGVKFEVLEPGFDDHLSGLVAGWHEEDVGNAIVFERLDRIHDVDDGAAGTDPHVLGRRVEMVGDGFDCGVPLCGLNVCWHFWWFEADGGSPMEGSDQQRGDRKTAFS